MNFFKKAIKEVQEIDKAIESFKETPEPTSEPKEEWAWVEGYKGTDKDMKCRGYQYELGVQYDMPENEPIKECKSGFHLCLSINDVYNYYGIGYSHRFFRVKALVRVSDVKKYGESIYTDFNGAKYYMGGHYDKLTSKSIIFLSELSIDEILKDTDAQNLPEEYKKMALKSSIQNAVNQYEINILVEDGYSLPFATYIIKSSKFDVAHAFGSQKELSMDMKVLGILYNMQGV